MSKTIKQIDKEIERLETLKDNLLSKTIVKCKNCGKGTQVNKLIFYQHYYYVEPYGCTGGAYWTSEDQKITLKCEKCKTSNIYNRYNKEYKKLLTLQYHFKEVIDEK